MHLVFGKLSSFCMAWWQTQVKLLLILELRKAKYNTIGRGVWFHFPEQSETAQGWCTVVEKLLCRPIIIVLDWRTFSSQDSILTLSIQCMMGLTWWSHVNLGNVLNSTFSSVKLQLWFHGWLSSPYSELLYIHTTNNKTCRDFISFPALSAHWKLFMGMDWVDGSACQWPPGFARVMPASCLDCRWFCGACAHNTSPTSPRINVAVGLTFHVVVTSQGREPSRLQPPVEHSWLPVLLMSIVQ